MPNRWEMCSRCLMHLKIEFTPASLYFFLRTVTPTLSSICCNKQYLKTEYYFKAGTWGFCRCCINEQSQSNWDFFFHSSLVMFTSLKSYLKNLIKTITYSILANLDVIHKSHVCSKKIKITILGQTWKSGYLWANLTHQCEQIGRVFDIFGSYFCVFCVPSVYFGRVNEKNT